jgi:NADPH:quinone reductase-like Zn-dependent oxidoreductase
MVNLCHMVNIAVFSHQSFVGIQRVTNGAGIDLLIDNVGSETCKEGVRALKFNGIVCPVVSYAEGNLEVSTQQCGRPLYLNVSCWCSAS